ncbi:MAG: ankyrin repeat domain-containing protein [Verrucomicrobia bacterium]|nr:ankyrin repeat domain-containing protein [Verrucomicrobiota bacterium]
MKRLWFALLLCLGLAAMSALAASEIHEAAAAGDVEKVRALLTANPALANVRSLGTTPLHEAARHGHTQVAELLLSNGAQVNALDSSAITPLKLALGYQRKETAELLRQHGGLEKVEKPPAAKAVAPPAVPPRTNFVQTPPYVPAPVSPVLPEVRQPERVAPIAPAPATNRLPTVEPRLNPVVFPIHDAAEVGDAEQVKALLREWPELIEAQDEKGLTPLHVAAANARTNVALVLLSRRANAQAKTKAGYTPLHYAARHGNPAGVALLLSYGAQVNATTTLDSTPLWFAAQGGHVEVARLLLDRGADVNAGDKPTRSTPLHLAALNGSPPMVELLLARGANVNAQDAQGDTPLGLASAKGREAIVAALRSRGGQNPRQRPLSPMEESLVNYYRGIDQAFRTGSASEKKKTSLAMLPSKADVEKMFPRHAAQAWKVVEQLNREIKAAADKGFIDASKEPPIVKLQPAPPSPYIQQCQAKGWLAADLTVHTLLVGKQGRIVADAYCFVNGHWVSLPPLDRIVQE